MLKNKVLYFLYLVVHWKCNILDLVVHIQIYSVFDSIKKGFIRNESQNNIDISDILNQQQPQYNKKNVVEHLLQFVGYFCFSEVQFLLLSEKQ